MATNNDLKWVITSKPEWTDVTPMEGQGDMQVNVTIHEDVGDPAETAGTITVTCTSCKEQKQRQISVCRCVCNCDRLSIVWSADEIGSEELPSGTQIGTYTINGSCTEDNVNATINKNGESGQGTTLNLSGGKIKTTKKIAANTSPNSIQYDINVNINNSDECTNLSHQITQQGITCDCNKVLKSVTFNDIPQSGLPNGAQVGSYTLNTNYQCPTDALSATLSGDDGTEYVLTMSSNKLKLPSNKGISANTDPDNKHFNLVVKYNNDTCYEADIVQEGTGCGCGTIITSGSINITIPRGGVVGGNEIGTYRKASSLCSDNDITGTLTNGGNTYNLTFSNNKIYLQNGQTIGENSDTEAKTFAFKLFYQNGECTAFRKNVDQPGTGCGCGNLTSVSFNTIPTEGVTANTQIGTFAAENICMPNFSFTSTTLQLTTNGNKIITTQDIPSTSKPTGETYIIKANFMGEPCEGEYTLQQDGLDCSCSSIIDITYSSILTNHIPQTGLTANTPVLTYTLNDGCSDSNLNVTFSYIGASQNLTLRNGTGYLSQKIGEAGGLRYINSSVSYSGSSCSQWDDTFIQEGAACTCDSIRLSTDDASNYARLPYAGTHGEWVVIASGDTGLYDSQDNLIDVCGSLSGVCGSEYLEPDSQGNKVVVEGVETNDEFDIPHIYLFKVNVKGIDNPPPGDYTITVNLYFKDKEGVVTPCVNRRCDFILTDNACDCNKRVAPIVQSVPCEGTSGIATLASVGKSSIPVNMTMEAELLNPDDSLITDFTATASTSGFFLRGRVTSENDTGSERTVGTARVYYYCNKGGVNEWYCGYDDIDLKQSPCESCTCEEINGMIIKDLSTYMPYSSNTKTVAVTNNATNKACLDVYIPGQDESGIYTGTWTGSGGSPAGTFTAKIVEDVRIYGKYYNLVITMPDGDTHQDRTATVPIRGRYKTYGSDEWIDCDETYSVSLNDEACDCTTASAAISRYMTGSTGGIPNSAVTFDKGSTLEYLGFINFGGEKDETCIRLCIFDAPNLTGCTKAEKYVDPNEYFEAYGETYLNQGRIFFNLLKDLDSDKLVWFAPSYLNNGEWKPCGQYWQVRLHQEKCTCDEFKSNVTTYTEPFVHNQTGSLTDLKVVHIYNACGCGRLYVFDNQGNGYAAENINNLPDELQYIKGMTEGCFGNSYDRPGQPDGYLTVEPLTKEQAEQLPDKKRITHMGVCWCDGCGEDGDTKLDENNVCECIVEFDVTEMYETDCTKYTCNDYHMNFYESCASFGCRIPHTGNIDDPKLIGTYDVPPECFSVTVTCNDENVESCTTALTETGKVGIYIECKSYSGQEDTIINVDVNSYKDGSSSYCEHENIKVTLEHP